MGWFRELICSHKYKRTTPIPPMTDDEYSMCSYSITIRCDKCGKEKEVWSDVHLGMRILTEDEIKIIETLKKV